MYNQCNITPQPNLDVIIAFDIFFMHIGSLEVKISLSAVDIFHFMLYSFVFFFYFVTHIFIMYMDWFYYLISDN